MTVDPSNLETGTPPAPGGAGEGPSFRGTGVDTGETPGGALPGVLRFFVVPLVLVGASLAVFAGLGALVGQGPPTPADLVRSIAEGGKNSRWQAAQELSNLVARGDLDLARDERLTRVLAEAFERARVGGDDPRVLEHLSILLGRADPAVAGPALRKALADGNPDVRIFALGALSERGGPLDAAAVLPLLDDVDPAVRAVASFATAVLAERNPSAASREALAKAQRDPAVEVRWNAALGLARLGDPAGADIVWSLLHRDYVRANLKTGDGPEAGGFFSPRGADPAGPAELEERVVLNALSAAYRLRDRSMADGVKALAASDPSDAVRDWAMKAAGELEKDVREKGPTAQRAWVAAR
jgi:HEAT repeat protein